MSTKDIQEDNVEIKTKPNMDLGGFICFFAFFLCIIFLIFINFKKTENNNFKCVNLLIIITAITFFIFAVEKMNLKTRVYIKLTKKQITIYHGILSDKIIIETNDIKKILNMEDKIILILKNNGNHISIVKKNMDNKGENVFISKLSKYIEVTDANF